MISVVLAGVVLVIILLALWGRYRPDAIPERLLRVEGLDGLCRDYLDYIAAMTSGTYDTETIRQIDAQRQVTHDQILRELGIDRTYPLDMERFARRYLGY